ncbi:DUF2075 domain-containing protein [Hymenobacter siberiensis]|uniref:DUF2075 domain-containing protein n=1 Tax=Hymenobacter siberiensis TaxID=2848396 RepID=UPI001C1E5960|nr:DUF2075 domain-containing protein [Hymenobacter siberiensis]MBU6122281.1 DUF2075 domain-containing protein [Hymenobacter siberiensis]
MIVYQKSKAEFREDVFSNNVENIIQAQVLQKLGKRTAQSEINSWRNSMQYMDRVLSDSQIPEDSGVSIEYQLPYSGLRIDFVLTGQDDSGTDKAIIIELKQWSTTTATDQDGVVATFLGRGIQEVNHPSYQAWSYAAYLEGFNETVYEENIKLLPCAYLHNHSDDGVLTSGQYAGYVEKAPLFFKSDAAKLRDFIREHVKQGDRTGIMYRIDGGRIKPSKQLAEALAGLLKGKQEFILLDEQKVVYETARKLAAKATNDNKQVLIVRGGPGTGKTVVAINLLVALTKQPLNAKYISRNSAPRHVYKRKLTGTMRGSRFDSLFVGSGGFTKTSDNTFDALIVDEAHRLNEKSGIYRNLGENQIKEIITSARCSIFFLDENQRIAVQDIGSEDEIRHWAAQAGAEVHVKDLHSQFRCNGSDAYMAWLDSVLDIRETANPTLDATDYDFKVVETPDELQQLIYKKNALNNRARMAAGYCWKWNSKKDDKKMDFQLSPTFQHRWNLSKYGNNWIDDPGSVTEVGCIHTTQGLELDYIGVIIGPDLVVRDGQVITDAMARAGADKTVEKKRELMKSAEGRTLLDEVIKNTYRTLMTRAMKGCYVYCTDPETAAYLRRRTTQPS